MLSTFRILKCVVSVGQIAMAAILLGQAPQGALAFAPSSVATSSRTTASSTRYRSQYTAVSIVPHTTKASSSPFFPAEIRQSGASSLHMSNNDSSSSSSLPVFLDPGTKGGAVVLSLILFIIPIIGYQVATGVFGVDEIDAGRYIGVGFTVVTMILWGATYIFRVATKDMTYAKQLKDYEDAVIAKRLEELDEDEVQALVEDIEREQF